jgi:hypothetical protein
MFAMVRLYNLQIYFACCDRMFWQNICLFLVSQVNLAHFLVSLNFIMYNCPGIMWVPRLLKININMGNTQFTNSTKCEQIFDNYTQQIQREWHLQTCFFSIIKSYFFGLHINISKTTYFHNFFIIHDKLRISTSNHIKLQKVLPGKKLFKCGFSWQRLDKVHVLLDKMDYWENIM